MTAYQGNGSNVVASVLAIANQLAHATGGTETSNNTALTPSTTGWIIVRSQGIGTSQTGAGSEPTISDTNMYGWFEDSNLFDQQTLATGNYTPVVALNVNSSSIVADIHCISIRRPNGGGAYQVIGDQVLSAQTIGTTRTVFTFSASSFNSVNMAIGDRFGYVFIINITSGSALVSSITIYMSTSASNGVANDAQLNTPGFSPTGPVTVIGPIVANAGYGVLVSQGLGIVTGAN